MMTITTAASEMVRDWLRRSEIANPVVYLGQVSNTPPALDEAVKRGARKHEIREIASRVLGSEPRYLYPLIYPRSHFLWLFTTTIAGVRFASRLFYPPRVRGALKRGILDVAERGLVLKDVDGTIVLPRPAVSAL